MADRYFVESPIEGDRSTLAGPEAHHLLHVMRAKPGDEVVLFDGSGAEFPARVERTSRATVELAVLSRQPIDRELPQAITLGVALPKGDRQKWLVEKAVELGIAELVPLATERSVAQPADGALERLRRSVIEASKQCGRNRLMRIAAPLAWKAFLDQPPTDSLRLVAHPGGAAQLSPAPNSTAPVYLAIGPEGGLSDAEVYLAKESGWHAVSLGARILRVETAAVYLAALVSASQ